MLCFTVEKPEIRDQNNISLKTRCSFLLKIIKPLNHWCLAVHLGSPEININVSGKSDIDDEMEIGGYGSSCSSSRCSTPNVCQKL